MAARAAIALCLGVAWAGPASAVNGGAKLAAAPAGLVELQYKGHASDDWSAAHSCGGALIAPHWILTAAHCLYEDGKPDWDPTVRLWVRAGITTLDAPSGWSGGLVRFWTFGYVPEDKQGHPPSNDIALVRLDSDAPDDIKPMVLPPAGAGPWPETDDQGLPVSLFVTGWGGREPDTNADQSRMSRLTRVGVMTIVDRGACADALNVAGADAGGANLGLKVAGDMLCAMDPRDKIVMDAGDDTAAVKKDWDSADHCEGDSGGPLFKMVGDDFLLLGIVSWGLTTQNLDIACGGGLPSLFANVAQFRSQIDATMQRDDAAASGNDAGQDNGADNPDGVDSGSDKPGDPNG